MRAVGELLFWLYSILIAGARAVGELLLWLFGASMGTAHDPGATDDPDTTPERLKPWAARDSRRTRGRLKLFCYIASSKYRKATHQRWRQQSPMATTLEIFGVAVFLMLLLSPLWIVLAAIQAR